jgi:D-alanine-D-alanine ligase
MTKVGVLRGGPGHEYYVSLESGAHVLSVIQNEFQEKYKPVDILLSKDGYMIINGKIITPEKLRHHVDLIFNTVHGSYGEDGKLQQLLDSVDMPFIGSGSVASAISSNKKLAKERLRQYNVNMSDEYIISGKEYGETWNKDVFIKEHVQNIFLKFSPPWVVKPIAGGSSIAVSIVKTRGELQEAITHVFEHASDVIVEPFIYGKEATVSVTDNFRGQKCYAFPPIEIRVPKGRYFDFDIKYNGQAEEIVPGKFSDKEKKKLEEVAKLVHKELGLKHWSRSDFIVSPKGIYFLEVNTVPGFTKESLFPKAVKSVGTSIKDFVHHLIELAKYQR